MVEPIIEEYLELEKQELELVEQKEQLLATTEVFKQVKALEEQVSLLATQKADMKEQIKNAMEQANVKKFENDLLSITYVAPTTRIGVDTDKLKTEFEEIYLQVLKETPVKSSIRLKVK